MEDFPGGVRWDKPHDCTVTQAWGETKLIYTAPLGREIVRLQSDESTGEIVVTLDNNDVVRVAVAAPHGVTVH